MEFRLNTMIFCHFTFLIIYEINEKSEYFFIDFLRFFMNKAY
jgi:hypothetical protein